MRENYKNFSINGYTAKRVVDISNQDNGIEKWYEVKNSNLFSILFNPESATWLKMVNDDEFNPRIEQSYQAQLAVLHLIGADLLMQKCNLVEIGSKKGFTSPHFGETIESIIKARKRKTEIIYSEEDLNWFYYQGYLLAKELLKESNWWMDDPNPGNIVISDRNLNIKSEVVLIDFSNKNSRRKFSNTNINELEFSFNREAKKTGLNGWKYICNIYSNGLILNYDHTIINQCGCFLCYCLSSAGVYY